MKASVTLTGDAVIFEGEWQECVQSVVHFYAARKGTAVADAPAPAGPPDLEKIAPRAVRVKSAASIQPTPDAPQKTRRKWTDEDLQKIARLKEQGVATPLIAEALKTSVATLYYLMSQHRAMFGAKNGSDVREQPVRLASAVERTRDQIIDWMRSTGIKIAVLDDRVIHDGRDLTDSDIVRMANAERRRVRLPLFNLAGA